MDAQSIGPILTDYLERTKNSNTGRPYTPAEFGKELAIRTGLSGIGLEFENWQRGKPFPNERETVLEAIASLLAYHGALKAPEEIDRLYAAAGYERPTKETKGFILIGAGSGGSAQVGSEPTARRGRMRKKGEWQGPDESNRPPQSQSKVGGSGATSFEAIVPLASKIEKRTPPLDQPPQPETPDQQDEFDHNGLRIAVAQTERGWWLPGIDALVIAPSVAKTGPAGMFYEALHNSLDQNAATQLDKLLIRQISRRRPTFDTPLEILLPDDLARSVLPFTPAGQARIVVTTLRGSDGTPKLEHISPLIQNLLALANAKGFRNLAMPILGSGNGDLGPETILQAMLEVLLGQRDRTNLQSITFLTIESNVVDAARRKFNPYRNNRGQPLANDEPSDFDTLGIAPEIEALTDTLMLRESLPSQAVGIMGTWGSGKSSVMKIMRRRMLHIRSQAVAKGWPDDPGTGREPVFVGHIYQIWFNAWTYAKSNLWASLIHTIFFELNRQLSLDRILSYSHDPKSGGEIFTAIYDPWFEPGPDLLAKAREEDRVTSALWGTMRKRKRKQLQLLQAAEQEIANAKLSRDLAVQKKQEAVSKALGDQAQLAALSALTRKAEAIIGTVRKRSKLKTRAAQQEGAAAPEPAANEPDAEDVIGALRGIGATLANVWQVIGQNKWLTLGLVAFTALGVFGVYWLARLLNLSLVQSLGAWAAPLIPAALALLQTVRKWAKRVDEIVREYQSQVEIERGNWEARRDERLAQERAKDEKKVAAILANKKLGDADKQRQLQELTRVEGNLAAHDRLLEQLELQAEDRRKKVGATAKHISLFDFVRSRLDESLYEDQLGLMHQVHEDFQELSNSLTLSDNDAPDERAEKKALFPRGEPRVVLFIDDLDRCPPSRVVEMMEAIQLLLKTGLFLVVLAIDTRYATRALEKEYKDILRHDGDPSGLDYIEKIIQIPYRVRPIEAAGLQAYLRSQMEIAVETSETPPAPAEPETDSNQPAETPRGITAPSPRPGEPAVKPTPVDLPPEIIKFQSEDYDDLYFCCNLIDLTPRSIKRLVTVLKLVKIFWFRGIRRDQPRPVKRTVMALLALSAAYPEVMREAFIELEPKFKNEQLANATRIIDALGQLKFQSALAQALEWQIDRYGSDVRKLKSKKFGNVKLAELSLPTFNLVRSFSFVGDPSYGADNSEDGAARNNPEAAKPKAKRRRKVARR